MTGPQTELAIDVSNTLDGGRLSGIQRVAVRVIEQLSIRPEVDLTLLDGRSGQLRPIRLRQRERLLGHFDRAGSRAIERLERKLARAVPTASSWRPSPNQWFLDIEPSWHGPQDRAELLTSLDCPTAAVIYDLLPLTERSWFPPESGNRFANWFEAHVAAGSRLMAISHVTAAAVANYLDVPEPAVIRLGVDATDAQQPSDQGLILQVGTIEPRKGHRLLLDALDLLPDQVVLTVDIVGSPGWAEDSLLDRLDAHPRVRWHRALGDHDLDQLWKLASMLVQPSLAEGFGLPIAEALARKIPVLATDIPVFAEVSKGLAGLVEPTAGAWAEALAAPRGALRERAAGFEPWTWANTADDVLAALRRTGNR